MRRGEVYRFRVPKGLGHEQRVRVLRAGVLILALGLFAASCGTPTVAPGPGPYEHDWFTVSPPAAREGDSVAVIYLREATRGVDFLLYDRFRRDWRLRYVLIAGRVAYGLPESAVIVDATRLPKNFGIPDSIVSDSTSDRVTLPKALASGDYLLCTSVSPPVSPPQWRAGCTTFHVAGRPSHLAPQPR